MYTDYSIQIKDLAYLLCSFLIFNPGVKIESLNESNLSENLVPLSISLKIYFSLHFKVDIHKIT